jgi:hypothetical protein
VLCDGGRFGRAHKDFFAMTLRLIASTALLALALAGCGGGAAQPCTPASCPTGCCTADGQCAAGTATDACGAAGVLCGACAPGQQCTLQACVAPVVEDAGADAGTSADAGTGVDAGIPVDAGPPITAPADTWTWVDVPDSQCGNGAPTGLAVNPTGRSTDLFIYLQGGGACWEGISCFVLRSAVNLETGYTGASFAADPSRNAPFFSRANLNNPLKDMSYVYVPYCTGDVHAGDSVRAYDAQNPNRRVFHKGGKNIDAFLPRLKATFPNVARVFVAGSSAGAYGAQLNFPKVRATWPNAEVHLLADCGQMLNPSGTRLSDWLTAWNVTVPSDCAGCTTDFPKFPTYLATKYPASRFALLAYEQDNVLSQFFGYDLPTFQARTRDLLTASYDGRSNARYFVSPAVNHVMLYDLFTLIGPRNVPLLTFTTDFVAGDPAWANVK